MEQREPPQTEEGWYVLHDFRTIDWDAWRAAPHRDQERAVSAGVEYLRSCVDVTDAEAGESAVFSVLGHKADLLVLHLRPTLEALDALERRFETTELGEYTERASSYVSITEASGYSEKGQAFIEGEDVGTGLERYMESRLYPDLPDDDYVCFYPMDKRRAPEQNWYDLPFDDRAEHIQRHGDLGREHGSDVAQIIAGSIGLDDFEWGITLFAEDMTDVKRLLTEMRFDPSTSKFADFGPFYVGRQFAPADLGTLFSGHAFDAEGDHRPHADSAGHPHGESASHGRAVTGAAGERDDADAAGHPPAGADHGGDDEHADDDGEDGNIRGDLRNLDIYAGKPHGEDVYAMVLYSEADGGELFEEVRGLRANFDHYDTHVKTAVYEGNETDENAVVSIWETKSAADTAGGFLSDLPGIVRQAGDTDDDSWGTMGMFYTVKPEHRGDFVEKFETVGGLLEEMDGHRDTALLANREDENDMFIASRWDSQDDAMAFFRSEEFSDTVDWGRDVLADRPRHVFLA